MVSASYFPRHSAILRPSVHHLMVFLFSFTRNDEQIRLGFIAKLRSRFFHKIEFFYMSPRTRPKFNQIQKVQVYGFLYDSFCHTLNSGKDKIQYYFNNPVEQVLMVPVEHTHVNLCIVARLFLAVTRLVLLLQLMISFTIKKIVHLIKINAVI